VHPAIGAEPQHRTTTDRNAAVVNRLCAESDEAEPAQRHRQLEKRWTERKAIV
jgi:hypothetical protein